MPIRAFGPFAAITKETKLVAYRRIFCDIDMSITARLLGAAAAKEELASGCIVGGRFVGQEATHAASARCQKLTAYRFLLVIVYKVTPVTVLTHS